MDNKEKFAKVTEEDLEKVNGGNDEQNNWKRDIPGWEGQWFYFDTPGEQYN